MKKHIITSLVIIAISSLVVAQSSRMGSASSTQLLVVPSAKHLSGGGAAATATGMDATFWNPAGLAMSENGIDAIFSSRQYIADIENGFAGGVYTFLTIENAKTWFNEDRIKWITERYSKPEITYYESPVIVDNEKNKIIS